MTQAQDNEILKDNKFGTLLIDSYCWKLKVHVFKLFSCIREGQKLLFLRRMTEEVEQGIN